MLSEERTRRFVTVIESLIPVVNKHQDRERPPCTGVWICLRDRIEGDATMVHREVGTVTDENKRPKYQRISRRKVDMLLEPGEHETSWQVRSDDPNAERYGGGVKIADQADNGRIIDKAVSGFPEPADTAAVAYAAWNVGAIDEDEAWRLVSITTSRRWLQRFIEERGQPQAA